MKKLTPSKKNLKFILTLFISLLGTISMAQYNLSGSATSLGGDCYRLTTTSGTFNSGSIWYRNRISLASDLTVEGTLNFGNLDADGADGMVFIMQPICARHGSNAGGYLGFNGVSPSIGVEFDTWQNTGSGFNDPSDDHIALMKMGDQDHAGANNLQGPVSLSNIEDGNDHTFKIEWIASSKTLKVTFDGTLHINYSYDIVANIFGNNSNVFWGFVGATGSVVNNHTVCISSASYVVGSHTVTNASCPDFNNGAIDLNPTGGIAPFTYLWSNSQTTQDISGLTPGTYSVVVNDGGRSSCTSTFTMVVGQQTDNVLPTISCVDNQTKNGSSYTVSGTEFDPTAYADNCGSATISNDYNNSSSLSGAVFNSGTTTVVWTVMDASNNAETCSLNVVIQNESCGAGTPSGDNFKTGDIIINTQTQMDAFFNSSNSEKWTKVIGNLTIDGNSSTDPISSLCNLSSLTEVTGSLYILNFKKTANPTDLDDLSALTDIGCRLEIRYNNMLNSIGLAGLQNVGCTMLIMDNANANSISLPALETMAGEVINITNNPKLQTLSFSTTASSFNFTGTPNNCLRIVDNGGATTGALTMNFKKLTSIKGYLYLINNDNTGVSNFDDIFTGLTYVGGKLTITNNNYLSTCCIAATATVVGTRTISGNTGNCASISAVVSACGSLHKKATTAWKVSEETELSVYPSPNKGRFTIELSTPETGAVKLSVEDLMGRTVFTQSLELTGFMSIPVNLESLAEGQYIVKADINGQIITKRVVLIK